MKPDKTNNHELQQLLLDPVARGGMQLKQETIAELELSMTNSAIGFEYARLALEEEGLFGLRTIRLNSDIEEFQRKYFSARDKLQTLDKQRVSEVEENLQQQKKVLFSSVSHLH